jgi:hypothetical protein
MSNTRREPITARINSIKSRIKETRLLLMRSSKVRVFTDLRTQN